MRTKEIEEIAARAAAHHSGKAGFANALKVNAYVCENPACGRTMITIDREAGVTPFLTTCPACGKMAQSAFYRVDQRATPTHEWYRPDTLDGLARYHREHVEKGGLLLRRIEDEEHPHRDPEWRRFIGDISNVAMVSGNVPTVGVAADICPDCDKRRVLIACISAGGHECSIGVDPQEALKIAGAIHEAAMTVIRTEGEG